MLPPVLAFLSIVLMLLLHTIVPVVRVIQSPYTFTGIGLVLAGVLIILWSANYFRRVQTTIHPFGEVSFLATSGLYKISRNPMYLGMFFILVGVAISLGTLTSAFVLPLFVWSIAKRHINKEEQALERIFGNEYIRYKQEVPRWI